MAPFLNLNLPAQGQRSMQALRLLYRSGVRQLQFGGGGCGPAAVETAGVKDAVS